MLTLRTLFERNIASLILPLFNLGFSGTALLLLTGALQRARKMRPALQPERACACPAQRSGVC